MKRLALLVLGFGAFAAFAACGGNGDGTNDGGDMRGAYPAGPYGMTESSIIESLTFKLHNDMPFTLEDVWKDQTKKLMLITTAAGWCSACIEEQPSLKEYHAEYGPKGLFILEAIFEDAAFVPATVEYTSNWQRQYDLPFAVVVDNELKFSRYYMDDLAPMNMFVDVATMKILRISTGFAPNDVEAILMARLP